MVIIIMWYCSIKLFEIKQPEVLHRENKNLMNLKLDYLYLCNMLDISRIIMGREKES
jgi:hypothetical protein